jgi:protein-S-isoprenylcysteine O-methyltransferase Ste14
MSTDGTRQDLPAWFQETRKKGVSVTGNALFTLLRLADLPFQYYLLSSGAGLSIVHKLGGTGISSSITSPATAIGLSPYHSLVFGLAVGSAAKQIYWCLVVADNKFEPGFSAGIAAYNTVLNTVNTLLTLWAVTSNRPAIADTWTELFSSRYSVALGAALYGLGLWTEWWCEVQRKHFKQNPANKGKLCTEGLFGLARNINYGGYTLWRASYSTVCAGLPWGVGMFAFLAGDFAGRAIPLLEKYLANKVSFQIRFYPKRHGLTES